MSDTVTMTLTEFLLARIAEDEAGARIATPGPWTTVAPHEWADWDELLVRAVEGRDYWTALITPAGGEHGDDGMIPANAMHIARHDPARVLAECRVKRELVEIRSGAMAAARAVESVDQTWSHLTDDHFYITRAEFLAQERILRALAAVYADHPDYRDEWRP